MIETRIAKIVMVGSLPLFAELVTFDNLTDHATNYVFVRQLLSMDATPLGNALMYRSIFSPLLGGNLCLDHCWRGRNGTRRCRCGDFAAARLAFAGRKLQPHQSIGAPEEGSFGTFRQLDDVVIKKGQTARRPMTCRRGGELCRFRRGGDRD